MYDIEQNRHFYSTMFRHMTDSLATTDLRIKLTVTWQFLYEIFISKLVIIKKC